MRYYMLACDYDGTLAREGRVSATTLEALRRFKASGRKLVLVTGRQLEDLRRQFESLELFERIVAENGGVLFRPASGETRLLAGHPPERLGQVLRQSGVAPLAVGQVVLATCQPHEIRVLEAVRELGLEYHIIFNKGAVMVLPSAVNKASGLKAALSELGLSPHNVAGVGDAENDHAFLELCEFSVATANALPPLQERVDWVTTRPDGEGVVELIERILREDSCPLEPRPGRGAVVLGVSESGRPVPVPAYGVSILLAGSSGGGKSSLVTGLIERLIDAAYQSCVIDPEGDYPELERAIVLGDSQRSPAREEVLKALEKPEATLVVNLMGLGLEERPSYFQRLLPELLELRTRTGRPHWLVIDETHHVLPESWRPAAQLLPSALKGLLMVTVHPGRVAPMVLAGVDLVLAIGQHPAQTLGEFAQATGRRPPPVAPARVERGALLAWWVNSSEPVRRLQSIPARSIRRRHVRKYMQGELAPERSFVFVGPAGELHLRAHNLRTFLELAEGVDEATWNFHLRRNDYSRWMREGIKDEELARAVEQVESAADLPAAERKARLRAAVEQRYTEPE